MGLMKTFRRRLKKLHPLYSDIERLNKRLDMVFEIIDPDRFHTNGERQVTPSLDKIRPDHLGRYEFATRYLKDGFDVLDIACGIGYGSFITANNSPGANILGVDISDKAIEYANKYYKTKNNSFIIGDCLKIDLKPLHNDVVISFETIEHIEGADKFLRRINKSMKPGALLICSTPNERRLPFNKKDFPHHLRHYTLAELDHLITEAGFNIESRHSQHKRKRKEVRNDSNGLYHIFVCRKPE